MIGFLVLSSVAMAAQSVAEDVVLTDSERAWLAANPTVKSSINTSYAPIDFVVAGEPAGFSVDYLNLVAAKVGLTVEYGHENTLSHNLEMLKNKDVDIVHSISENEERAQYFLFSSSYLDSPVVNYGRVGAEPINTIADLEGKKVGVVRGTILHNAYLKLNPNIKLIEFNNVPDAFRALSTSGIDVYTGNLVGTNYLISQTSINGLEVIGSDLVLGKEGTFQHTLATHKDNPILMNIIKKGMSKVSDEELAEIYAKWVGAEGINIDIGLTHEELDWLANNRKIAIAAVPDGSPYEFIDADGTINGISREYLNIISKKLNIEFYWSGNETLLDGFDNIKSSKALVASAVTATPERQKFLDFTDSYLSVGYMIFTRSDTVDFGSLAGLSGRKIAQVPGYAITEYLEQNHPDIEILNAATVTDALHMVNDGEADAFVGSIASAASIIVKDGLMQIHVIGDTAYETHISIAVSKQAPLLFSAIDKVMNSISIKNHAEISNKWTAIRVEEVENYHLIWQVALAFSVVLIIFAFWNRKLAVARMEAVTARKEAEAANIAKSAFFASISHDLRTPLNAIIGFSEVIKNETFGPVENKKYKEYNLDINKSGEYLLGLVNDILDVSALEAGEKELYFEMIDFGETADACQTLVHKLAEDKNIDYRLSVSDELSLVYADERAMMQVLMNLVSNAIKFTPVGGKVTVSTQSTSQNLEIEVSDTGIGISEEDIGLITQPFTRASGSPHHSRAEGTGLGLAIVKALVELHKGTLEIKSVLGEGTRAIVRIPIKAT